mmetsp:Transcript_58812/g.164224  ORF Transcript_58812/g.164224 Transcript_58812/m.164224 type:complete len:495 (-) Transcript_58812:292-1776(-)
MYSVLRDVLLHEPRLKELHEVVSRPRRITVNDVQNDAADEDVRLNPLVHEVLDIGPGLSSDAGEHVRGQPASGQRHLTNHREVQPLKQRIGRDSRPAMPRILRGEAAAKPLDVASEGFRRRRNKTHPKVHPEGCPAGGEPIDEATVEQTAFVSPKECVIHAKVRMHEGHIIQVCHLIIGDVLGVLPAERQLAHESLEERGLPRVRGKKQRRQRASELAPGLCRPLGRHPPHAPRLRCDWPWGFGRPRREHLGMLVVAPELIVPRDPRLGREQGIVVLLRIPEGAVVVFTHCWENTSLRPAVQRSEGYLFCDQDVIRSPARNVREVTLGSANRKQGLEKHVRAEFQSVAVPPPQAVRQLGTVGVVPGYPLCPGEGSWSIGAARKRPRHLAKEALMQLRIGSGVPHRETDLHARTAGELRPTRGQLAPPRDRLDKVRRWQSARCMKCLCEPTRPGFPQSLETDREVQAVPLARCLPALLPQRLEGWKLSKPPAPRR